MQFYLQNDAIRRISLRLFFTKQKKTLFVSVMFKLAVLNADMIAGFRNNPKPWLFFWYGSFHHSYILKSVRIVIYLVGNYYGYSLV